MERVDGLTRNCNGTTRARLTTGRELGRTVKGAIVVTAVASETIGGRVGSVGRQQRY